MSSCRRENVVVLPKVTTAAVSSITSGSAIGGGTIESNGGSPILAQGVVWSTSSSPTTSLSTKTSDQLGSTTYTSNITGLTLSTTYHVRAYATNSVGTAYGDEVVFTSGANLPTLTTNAINLYMITYKSATGGGTITSDGGAPILTQGVVWSTNPAPTILLGTKTMDLGAPSFTSILAGLQPLTKYYVRAYATNSAGTAYGNEESFTTSKKITTFNLLFSNTSLGTDVIQTADGGYVTSRDYIVKLDSLGNVLWSTPIVNDGNTVMSKVIQTKDLGYLVTNSIALQKFDANGNLVWISDRANSANEVTGIGINSSVETPEGQFLVLGDSDTIQKLDKNGNVLWTKYLTYNLSYFNAYITSAGDGNYIVVRGSESWLLDIYKIDSLGNLLWSKEYTYTYPIQIFNCKIERCADNSFIIGAQTAEPNDSFSNLVVKIDQSGNKLWDQSIPLGNGSYFYSITPLSDGGQIVAGNFYESPYSPTSAFMVKLDQSGDKVWELDLAPEDSTDFLWVFNSVKETRDKGLIILGNKNYVYSGTERGSWLLKTDMNGNF